MPTETGDFGPVVFAPGELDALKREQESLSATLTAAVPLRVFTCCDFTGHWPVGNAAVVVAQDAAHAAEILNQELHTHGLIGDADAAKMHELPTAEPRAVVLHNGDY